MYFVMKSCTLQYLFNVVEIIKTVARHSNCKCYVYHENILDMYFVHSCNNNSFWIHRGDKENGSIATISDW